MIQLAFSSGKGFPFDKACGDAMGRDFSQRCIHDRFFFAQDVGKLLAIMDKYHAEIVKVCLSAAHTRLGLLDPDKSTIQLIIGNIFYTETIAEIDPERTDAEFIKDFGILIIGIDFRRIYSTACRCKFFVGHFAFLLKISKQNFHLSHGLNYEQNPNQP